MRGAVPDFSEAITKNVNRSSDRSRGRTVIFQPSRDRCEVTLKMEMVGWAGTALVIVAYVPQLRHLYVEKCAWGISISTWLIWLIAGALLLSYCISRNDTLLIFVQIINIAAIVATILLARRGTRICPYHFRMDLKRSD